MSTSKRNYLLLGASLLIAGIIVESLSKLVMAYRMHVAYKTILVMFMIAFGYGLAESVIEPWAKRSLKILMAPFKRAVGSRTGKPFFYITLYLALFVIYLFIFVI